MKKNIENICYRKHYLKEVLARIDFLSPVLPIQNTLPKAISQAALKTFPISEPQDAVDRKLLIDGKNIKTEDSPEYKHWQFFGKDRDKLLKISKNFILTSYKKYYSYEKLTSDFFQVVEKFFDKYKDTQISRIGFRYINQIELQESKPLDWNDYIDSNLLSTLKHFGGEYTLSRALQNVEFSFDDYMIKFQFGMHNPDFPSPILKKVFVLDFDAYSNFATDTNGLKTTFDIFHANIQKLFESSIKDNLRRKMNG